MKFYGALRVLPVKKPTPLKRSFSAQKRAVKVNKMRNLASLPASQSDVPFLVDPEFMIKFVDPFELKNINL